jgi:hypothetical protein
MEQIRKMKFYTLPIHIGNKCFKSKLMMKKYLYSFLLLLTCSTSFAQYEYSSVGKNDAPVLGLNWGLVGGGFTAMLNNRDDLRADGRLDPQFMNFSWAAGVECMYWFQPTFGFGGQLMYWNAGAKYTGLDTNTKYKLSATAKHTYLKVPLMFYFKSYNRYYPNRRTRLNVCFGPYVAILSNYSDVATLKDEANLEVAKYGVEGDKLNNNGITGKINGKVFNPIDLGFVFGIGGEVRLWKRTVVSLLLRSDVGISNVENTKALKITYDGNPTPQDLNYWEGYYAKFISLTPEDKAAGYGENRRATKNFSVGAFLTLKKYF